MYLVLEFSAVKLIILFLKELLEVEDVGVEVDEEVEDEDGVEVDDKVITFKYLYLFFFKSQVS